MEYKAYSIYEELTGSLVADIYYDKETDKYRAVLLWHEYPIPIMFGFPEWGSRPNPDSKVIEAFLKDRVIPENRDYLKHILEANGIYEYNWKELIKLNKGRTTDDPYRVETHESPKETIKT